MSKKNQSANQTPDKSTPVYQDTTNPAGGKLVKLPEENGATSSTIRNEDNYIKKWLRSLTILHRGHWDAARYFEKVNLSLGIATAISAAISGTTAFSQLQQQADQDELNIGLQVAVGIFALTAAALGAVQAFVRPSELAARHKQAGQKFGKLRREIELNLNLGLPEGHKERETLLTDFRVRWDSVDEESLPLPKRIYDKAEAQYDIK